MDNEFCPWLTHYRTAAGKHNHLSPTASCLCNYVGYFIPVSILSLQKGDVNGENFKRIEFSLFIIKIRSHYVLSGCEWEHTWSVVIFSEYCLWMDLVLSLFVWDWTLNSFSFFCRSDILTYNLRRLYWPWVAVWCWWVHTLATLARVTEHDAPSLSYYCPHRPRVPTCPRIALHV